MGQIRKIGADLIHGPGTKGNTMREEEVHMEGYTDSHVEMLWSIMVKIDGGKTLLQIIACDGKRARRWRDACRVQGQLETNGILE
ncbi:hypothetical protein Golomagni_00767 [Golovinomyces magnicellulatus]|nr:hypothetical protein Golomagni_00767 [Golovinomyces magnicellulatus]